MGNKYVIADPRRCIGCKACMDTCTLKHFVPGDVAKARLNVVQITKTLSSPILCRQCEDAPCAAACPTKALFQEDDLVKIEASRCIGCRSCVAACPYGACDVVVVNDRNPMAALSVAAAPRGVVIKCDRCTDREAGPACVEACPKDALSVREHDFEHDDTFAFEAAAACYATLDNVASSGKRGAQQ